MKSLNAIAGGKVIHLEGITLSQITALDKENLLKCLADKEISDHTCRIPYPYTARDAQEWIQKVETVKKKFGKLLDWAIRNRDGHLIGGIGFTGVHLTCAAFEYRDEIGYWVAKPWWGNGIATKVLKAVCRIGFEEFNLSRIEAVVFSHNFASIKVLEKCGFQLEGKMKKAYFKGGNFVDGNLYAFLK